ncbi:MAG: hypothetical protein KBT57_01080 [bacterium]|nr:hypothetical protein [Candidatus Limimorpha equi]
MKTIKIIIVVAIAAALGFGIYKIATNEPEQQQQEEIIIPEVCEGTVASAGKLIEAQVNAVGDGDFKKLQALPEELRKFFANQNVEPECMTSVNVVIRNRCLVRFIAMARSEFAKKSWNWDNFKSIEAMTADFLKGEKSNSDLMEIDGICKEYRVIVNYNSNVNRQSKQLPSSIDDRWNYKTVENLLANVPTASAPVSNTTLYESTRKAAVQKKLHSGHVAFVDALMEKGKVALPDIPTDSQYRSVINKIADKDSEMALYQNMAKSLYGVSSGDVNGNVKRWNEMLDAFPKPSR